MTLTLTQLAGMWFSDDRHYSMWVGEEKKWVEVSFEKKVFLSEPINFLNDGKGFECCLSDSIIVKQLYNTSAEEILFSINSKQGEIQIWFKKRIM